MSCNNNKAGYVIVIAIVSALLLTFRPGMWLVNKPSNSGNEHYVKGWGDGCVSGSNSYSLIYAPLLTRPFIMELEDSLNAGTHAPADKTKAKSTSPADYYKSAWNQGYTLCRFYQSAVYELLQFVILIATLLFIGCRLTKRPS